MRAFDVINSLMPKLVESKRDDIQEIATTFAVYLEQQEALHRTSIIQLIYMAVTLGYYYRIFMTKNEVKYESSSSSSSSSDSGSDKPSGESGGDSGRERNHIEGIE